MLREVAERRHPRIAVIGERGVGLSGGQRQRVAIARALLVKPHMLIFDDSMSAVDAETEAKLQTALAPLLRACTAFIIAQRLSTVRMADTVFVMDGGDIVARGTHEELLHSSHLYAEILSSQIEDDEAGSQNGVPGASRVERDEQSEAEVAHG